MYKLPIDINATFQSECWTFYKTCILNTYEDGKKWLSTHMEVFLDKNYNAHFGDGERLYPLHYYSDILDISEVEINNIESNNIVLCLKELLNEGSYVVLDCDINEFFKNDFNNDIDIHEMLLYGFNDNEKVFYSPILNNSTGRMEEIHIKYDIIEKSFEKVKKHYQWCNNRFYRMYNFYYPLTVIKKKNWIVSDNEIIKRCMQKIDKELKGEKRIVSKINGRGEQVSAYSTFSGLTCLYGVIEAVNEIVDTQEVCKEMNFDLTKTLLKLYEFRCNMLSTIETLMKIADGITIEICQIKERYRELIAQLKKSYMLSFKWEKKKELSILKNIQNILINNMYEEEKLYQEIFTVMVKWYNIKYVREG